jgi:hypothetical protein
MINNLVDMYDKWLIYFDLIVPFYDMDAKWLVYFD